MFLICWRSIFLCDTRGSGRVYYRIISVTLKYRCKRENIAAETFSVNVAHNVAHNTALVSKREGSKAPFASET